MSDYRRLDQYLVESGLCPSREKAKEAIRQKRVLVNDSVAPKASLKIGATDTVRVSLPEFNFVSRAGNKLQGALQALAIDVTGLECLDIGASTGGFTDCLLQNGAKHVTCVDVGRDQLVTSLRNDARVTFYEGVHIADFSIDCVRRKVDLIVVDVSFISLMKISEYMIPFLDGKGTVLALIKPQFEVGRENIGKNGIVENQTAVKQCLERIKSNFTGHGLTVHSIIKSGLSGKTGNQEYFIHASR